MAAFRRDGGVTMKWLRLLAEDLVMALPENRQSKAIYSFCGKEIDRAIIGNIEWWGPAEVAKEYFFSSRFLHE